MTRIEITRHAAADPASVALLLAEPATEPVADGVDPLPTGGVSPVRRSGVGFRAGVELSIGDDHQAVGVLTVVPATDSGCDVRIELNPTDETAAGFARAWAVTFLDSLTERASERSSAA
jgi:hypothetical protein